MSMTRLTRLPVRVVCFGISGTAAFSGGTGCSAPADRAHTMAIAGAVSKTLFVMGLFSSWTIADVTAACRPTQLYWERLPNRGWRSRGEAGRQDRTTRPHASWSNYRYP